MKGGIPEKEIAIIDNTDHARNKHGYAWGGGDTVLSKEHIDALEKGKCVALFDGEYVTFLTLYKKEKP